MICDVNDKDIAFLVFYNLFGKVYATNIHIISRRKGTEMETHDISERPAYKDADQLLRIKEDTYSIVGTVAYLIGVQRYNIENRGNQTEIDAYDLADKDKNGRIIHYLCLARTRLERNFRNIKTALRGTASIYSADPLIKECIDLLHKDGIEIFRKNTKDVNEYLIEANKLISDRINNCKGLLPEWLSWDYFRDFVVMPNGLTDPVEEGTKFQQNIRLYPYSTYCNWPVSSQGNILNSDRKFINLLYSWHEDEFEDQSKVADVGEHTKDRIYKFIGKAISVCVVVDAENSDPYRLCATLRQLNDEYTGRITKAIIIDDERTPMAWNIFEKYVGVPVEHRVVSRVLEQKSLVDMSVAMAITKEFYANNTDSFMLVASDSDYWAMLDQLPEANFLMMVEREKCSPAMKENLTNAGVFYCYIDDFYSGDSDELQRTVITSELLKTLDNISIGNLEIILEGACTRSRAHITENEKKRMYQRLKQSVKLVIEDDGKMRIQASFRGNL